MTQPASRENEPSAFAWVFSSTLALLGAGAVAAGVLRRRRRDETLARGRKRLPGDS